MDTSQIQARLKKITKNFSKEEFIFDLLLSYGTPKATVTLLKKGRRNLSKQDNQIILKRKLFFQEIEEDEDLHETIHILENDKNTMRHSPRFIIVTDYATLLAVDTKTKERLDIQIGELPKYYTFFLPWAGREKYQVKNENRADRKAAEKMAKLYDEILGKNNITDPKKRHALNVFLARLLFCFFAEDTKIFDDNIFTNSVASHTKADGSDLDTYLDDLFNVLNTKTKDRPQNLPAHLQAFPYVNGGLFAEKYWTPKFHAKARKVIIECGKLDWKEINPDIFGSMIQTVVHPGERGSLGMHYTSVPNIMKVIGPLFLNELIEEFEQHRENKKKLSELIGRISKMKFFDPACGSGNFLIITYKELRALEMEIIEEMGSFSFSNIHLSQFYGIEIDDFAHEIAKLSLYLAEHQMNIVFKEKFGDVSPTLPLRETGNIFCGNATRVDWEQVCPKNKDDEVYVFGNPPYLGSSLQTKDQKKDLSFACEGLKNYKNLDYISCWFLLGARYIKGINSQLAFVSTNSICQGEQVSILWTYILSIELEISFAHTSFKWKNNAKFNAGVTVVIIGLRNVCFKKPKTLFSEEHAINAFNINPYLLNSNNIIVSKRNEPISKLPKMVSGLKASDNGHLLLNIEEYSNLIKNYPESRFFIKKYIGAKDFMYGLCRYCIWVNSKDAKSAYSIDIFKERFEKVRKFRLSSKKSATRRKAKTPYLFDETNYIEAESILIPQTGSERREYLPIGFMSTGTVISNGARAIYNAEVWVFGILSSKMHVTWVKAVSGRLKTDMQYSNTLCYNTFPLPPLTTKQKEEITRHVYTVLEARESHPEKTMAELYDPDIMPKDLRDAHHDLDIGIERIYRSKPFQSDEERLEYLFKLYEKMLEEEENL